MGRQRAAAERRAPVGGPRGAQPAPPPLLKGSGGAFVPTHAVVKKNCAVHHWPDNCPTIAAHFHTYLPLQHLHPMMSENRQKNIQISIRPTKTSELSRVESSLYAKTMAGPSGHRREKEINFNMYKKFPLNAGKSWWSRPNEIPTTVGLQQRPPNVQNFCIDSMKSVYDPNCLEDVRNCGDQEETKLIHV